MSSFAGSRATTTFRFGFIALDLISIILEDSGEYVCRVTSQSGCVESQALLTVTGQSEWQRDRFYNKQLYWLLRGHMLGHSLYADKWWMNKWTDVAI